MKRALAMTALAAACALAAVAAFSGSARATYGGATNGRIAFGMNVNGNTDVYTVRPNGEDLRRLTTDPGFDACAAYSADGKPDRLLLGPGRRPCPGVDDEAERHRQAAGHAHERGRDLPRLLAGRERDRLRRAARRATARNIYVVPSDGGGRNS